VFDLVLLFQYMRSSESSQKEDTYLHHNMQPFETSTQRSSIPQ